MWWTLLTTRKQTPTFTKIVVHNQTHQQFGKGSLKISVHAADYKIKIRMCGTLVKRAWMREYLRLICDGLADRSAFFHFIRTSMLLLTLYHVIFLLNRCDTQLGQQ